MGYIILFFIAGPVIIGVGNLILGPIFNKRTPLHVVYYWLSCIPYSRYGLLFFVTSRQIIILLTV